MQKHYVYGSLSSNMCTMLADFKKLNLSYEKQRSDYLDPTICLSTFEGLMLHGVIISNQLPPPSLLPH